MMGAFHIVRPIDENEPRQYTTRIPLAVYREIERYAKDEQISVNEAINRAVLRFMTALQQTPE